MASVKGALEALYDGLLEARDDVRQKVVEEPWYGRAVTEGVTPPDQEKDSLAELYSKNIPQVDEPGREQQKEVELER